MRTTKEIHYSNSSYTEDRQKLHESIIENLLRDIPNEINQPIAILLGGGAASGKSTIGERYQKDLRKYNKEAVYIDSDAIKEQIPEYMKFKIHYPTHAAELVHDESSDISLKVLNKAIEGRYDIFYDGTMKNKEKYENIISKLKDKGYEIFAVIVDVPLNVAYKRSHDRYLITQRMVSEHIIKSSHKGVAETFIKLKELFDSYALWDNSEYGKAGDIFAEKDKFGEKIHNEERFKQFYQKSRIKL